MTLDDLAALSQSSDKKILLFVLDGLGGLPMEPGGPTELEAARTPNMDRLAREGGCGLHEPVAPGITPGSGPGHLALFGYDPLEYRIGRGVLEALGIEFDLRPGDVAARGNFCTVDARGRVTDRRAGRIPTEEAAPLAERLAEIELTGARAFVQHVKEHRFLLVFRPDASPGEADREAATGASPVASAELGSALGARVADTDPGREGLPPLEPEPLDAPSEPTARLARAWLQAARERLAGEARANMALLRGFASLPDWPRFAEAYGMRALAVAAYPMYRGVARLVGMDAVAAEDDLEGLASALETGLAEHDFVFLHFKEPDRAGEDGDFDRKVACLEAADAILPRLLEAGPDVVLVTGDHSTPSVLRSHSWHPVPFLLHGGPARGGDAGGFGERSCATGSLGRRRGKDLLALAAARAGRLARFGA